jgi:GNAT superfamily N-acetyltransferase
MGEDARSGRPITGSGFTIFVHPGWRHKGIATKLYYAASDFYPFALDQDPLYTPAGAAWARSMLKREEGMGDLPYVRIYIQMPRPEVQAAIAAALLADLHKTQNQIAEDFGVRISHVRKIGKQNGIRRNRYKSSPPGRLEINAQ